MGGSPPQTVTTQTNMLPGWAEPYLHGNSYSYLDRAVAISSQTQVAYTGVTYAAQNTNETTGIANLALRGRNHAPEILDGRIVINAELVSSYINTNPFLANLFSQQVSYIIQELTEETLPRMKNIANQMGRFRGDSHAVEESRVGESVMNKIAELSMQIFGEDYYREKGRKFHALSEALVYGAESIKDAELLRKAGLYAREYTQGALTDAYQVWFSGQEQSIRLLNVLGNAIRATMGSSSQMQEQYYVPSPWSAVAGLAMTGLGLYGQMSNQITQPNPLVTSSRFAEPYAKTGQAMGYSGGSSHFVANSKFTETNRPYIDQSYTDMLSAENR